MGHFCPEIDGEDDDAGLGLTNVVQVNATHGLLHTRPTTPSNGYLSPGAGLAVVDISSGTPVCTRPFGINTWGADEPNWGQLSMLLGEDGYIYSYANGNNQQVVLTRVEPANAFDLGSYQYYHGGVAEFTSDRIYLANLTDTSPESLGAFTANQGSIIYSQYYKRYIMFSSYPNSYIYARTAPNPWGPWDLDTVNVFNAPDVVSYIYAPVVQTKFMADDGKWLLVSWTNANQLGVANIVC